MKIGSFSHRSPFTGKGETFGSYFQLMTVTSISSSLSATQDIGRNPAIRFWGRFPFALAAMTVHDGDPFVPD